MLCFAGVDEDNIKEVDWCTKTPQYDKVVREAVRKMFREMKPQVSQDGSVRVAKSNFSQSVSEVAANKTERKLLLKAGTFGKCSVFYSCIRKASNALTPLAVSYLLLILSRAARTPLSKV